MKKLFYFITLIFLMNIFSVSALSIVTHVPEKYTDVVAGERFYFEIEIKYPENPSRRDLTLNYEIFEDDNVIAHSKVLKAIETQASFTDFIVIPESAEKGMHIIKVGISDYGNLSEEVEASFQVVSSRDEQMRLYFFITLGVIVLVGIVIIRVVLKEREGNGKSY